MVVASAALGDHGPDHHRGAFGGPVACEVALKTVSHVRSGRDAVVVLGKDLAPVGVALGAKGSGDCSMGSIRPGSHKVGQDVGDRLDLGPEGPCEARLAVTLDAGRVFRSGAGLPPLRVSLFVAGRTEGDIRLQLSASVRQDCPQEQEASDAE